MFFDEFPWMDTKRSKFLMAFENFWNSYISKRSDIVVVICGSAASYMVKKIIKNKGGLHNRITQRIPLLPFSLKETEDFLKDNQLKYGRLDILRLYMVMGGVPYYMEKLKRGESVVQAINRLCFSKDGILHDEFENVFASLYNHSDRHEAIVIELSKVRKGLTRNDLSKKASIPTGGTLTNTLDELIESGFVSKYLPIGNKKKDPLYRLVDEYAMFYLKFIKDTKASGADVWSTIYNSQSYVSWSGFSFETVCLKHINQIKDALGIRGIYSEQGSWIEKNDKNGAQIDLIIDRKDNVINICEMKFSENIYSISKKYAEELRNKISMFKTSPQTKKNIFLTMITTFGVKENQYSLELVENSVTMDDLF